ncbi:MAG: hypothetical protein HPY62_03105 [Bacteroidales bacterium]|nr:hypothetical protein [Bacteroidales bacterium]
MKKLSLLIVTSFLLFSCEKEYHPIIENKDIPLLKRITVDGELFMEYTYTEERLPKEEKSKFHYTKHCYNNRNLLSTSEFYMDKAIFSSNSAALEQVMNRKEWVNPGNTEKSLTKIYEYNSNDQLVKTIFDRNSSTDGEYNEYTFENDRITRETMFWNGKPSSFIDFFYDSKGNLIREEKYMILDDGTQNLLTSTEYEFDNKNNPWLAFRRLMKPGKYTNLNNIVKETYTIHFEVSDPAIQKVQVSTYTYTYNHRGYPVIVNGEAEYIYE